MQIGEFHIDSIHFGQASETKPAQLIVWTHFAVTDGPEMGLGQKITVEFDYDPKLTISEIRRIAVERVVATLTAAAAVSADDWIGRADESLDPPAPFQIDWDADAELKT